MIEKSVIFNRLRKAAVFMPLAVALHKGLNDGGLNVNDGVSNWEAGERIDALGVSE